MDPQSTDAAPPLPLSYASGNESDGLDVWCRHILRLGGILLMLTALCGCVAAIAGVLYRLRFGVPAGRWGVVLMPTIPVALDGIRLLVGWFAWRAGVTEPTRRVKQLVIAFSIASIIAETAYIAWFISNATVPGPLVVVMWMLATLGRCGLQCVFLIVGLRPLQDGYRLLTAVGAATVALLVCQCDQCDPRRGCGLQS
ncbi:MAG: hypothetical protein QM770_02805 [Tepidisphaeraceae bacterium]